MMKRNSASLGKLAIILLWISLSCGPLRKRKGPTPKKNSAICVRRLGLRFFQKKDGKNITSCWGQNKNGICVVKKSKQKEWLERLNTLEDQIKYWTSPENMTDKTIEIIHLYYDM